MTQLFSQDSVAYSQNALDVLEEENFNGSSAEYSEEDVFVLPASFSQQRLWFLEQWEPGVYNIPIAVGLMGQLNREAMDWALAEIIRRHEVLRTTFKMVDNVLMQVVAPRAPIAVSVVDLLSFSRDVQKVKTRRLAKEDFQRPFDLSHGPLFRATLIKLSRHEHVLLLAMHHIISDGWSMEVLFRELQALYTAYVTGQPSPLPELPIQYADYAIWQREWLQGETLEQQLAYWKQQLGDMAVLQLPFDHPRPAIQTFNGAVQTFILPHTLTEDLKALSQRAGTTLFMTLMGAFQTLLFRYTEQSDIAVGIPVAGRTESNLEDLIGCFINTLVLRTSFAGNPTFLELLTRVRDVALGAYDHQDVPFEKLVEELQPDRDLSHNPLTQVMFALQNVPHGQIQVPGLTLLPLHDTENAMLADVGTGDIHKKQHLLPDSKTAMFDIDLTMWERDDEIIGELKYNIDLFEASTIDRLQEHFLLLLEAIVADPTRRVHDLPILSEEEWQQQIVEWNTTEEEFPRDLCFRELFEEQVERAPEAIALICEGEQVSYGELNQRANRLAHQLRELGVGRETVVALLAERGIALVTAILAVFKAGGAYLPLDPRHPVSRLRQVLTHSQSPLVLATPAFTMTIAQALNEMPINRRPRCIGLVDSAWAGAGQEQEDEDVPGVVGEKQLAYVIYTSGSTGVPKGAMVEQAGMLNHLFAKIAALQLTEADCVAQTASQCFDISVWQMLSALLVGGSVCIYPDEIAHDPAQLLEAVASDGVSILETVPSLLRALLESQEGQDEPVSLERLRWLVPTGEALPGELCQRWLALYPDIPLLNAYGPTECSDDVTHHMIGRESEQENGTMPIGTPIPGLRLYVLNRQGGPMPCGAVGEIYVGGIGVGRGYVGEASKTAEAFVPDAFGEESGGRLYKTGDVGRYRADGVLEFLGRVDQQVKVRGYRVELGEIEAVLRQQPGVKEGVVEAKAGPGGQVRLVAYVVKEAGESMGVEEWRRGLRETLPEYMVPTAYVELESLPLTANGKLDRRRLPEPEEGKRQLEEEYVAPRTEMEANLARIWAEVLEVERIGVHDDFFALGGHSLLTVRLMTQIEKELGQRLPVAAIFQGRTIEALAEMLRRHTESSPWSSVVELRLPTVDLLAEAELDLATCPEVWPGELATEPAHILLSGATGFLGVFLLHELLQQTSADIYCLVRASGVEQGRRKLQHALETSGLWQQAYSDRVKLIVGDLGQPLFGLSASAFEELSHKLDVIYHNGALVNMVYPYQELKAVNVQGTKDMLRLATHGKIKPLHYISTLSVFAHKDITPIQFVREQESIDDYHDHVRGGYAQSKWVAEKLVTIARSRGLPVAIYRPGRITGHSQTGAWRADDVLCRMMKGCIQLGSSPIFADDEVVEMTPVDYVSRAVVTLARRKASLGQSFHLLNPAVANVNELVGWINAFGYPVRQMPYEQWLRELKLVAESSASNELAPFLSMLPRQVQLEQPPAEQVKVLFDNRNSRLGLASTGIVCPSVDAKLMHTYLSCMVRSGFLPAPQQVAA